MSRGSLSAAVDHLLSALQHLQLCLRQEETLDSLSEEFEPVNSPEPFASAGLPEPDTSGPAVVWSPAWAHALQAATTQSALLAFDLTPVQLLPKSTGISPSNGWSLLERLAAAFRAGRAAHFALIVQPEREVLGAFGSQAEATAYTCLVQKLNGRSGCREQRHLPRSDPSWNCWRRSCASRHYPAAVW